MRRIELIGKTGNKKLDSSILLNNLTDVDKARFWNKINKNGPQSDLGTPCWIWLRSTNGVGYGNNWAWVSQEDSE